MAWKAVLLIQTILPTKINKCRNKSVVKLVRAFSIYNNIDKACRI